MRKRTGTKLVHAAGSQRFADFLDRNDITLAAAARALHVSAPTVLAWRDGDKEPTDVNKDRIEIWTKGFVRRSHWGVVRDAVKVRPYDRLVG
jgi:hypothetical protein